MPSRLRWERNVSAWLMVVVIGVGAIAMGVHQQLYPQTRALDVMRVPPPAYLFIALGGTLVGASLIGIIKRWGPLIPTLVIAVFIGVLVMPVTNNRQTDMITAVLGLAMAIALAVDFLRAKRLQDVTASHDHIDERTHPPAVPAKPVCGDESYPPDG